MAEGIKVTPLVSYPRKAWPGGRFAMQVDLQHDQPYGAWPYAEEEYELTCLVDASPYFSCEASGDQTVVLHRFGGSYGPALFSLTARRPEDWRSAHGDAGPPAIRVSLIAPSGVRLQMFELKDIEIDARHEPRVSHVAPPPEPIAPSAEPRELRWIHLTDLMIDERASYSEALEALPETPTDALFVAGDLTFAASTTQMGLARGWLGMVKEAFGAEHTRVFAVPGNHDADWGAVSHQAELTEFWRNPRFVDEFWRGSQHRSVAALRTGIHAAFARFVSLQRGLLNGLNAKEGLLPGDFAASFRSASGLHVGVVGLNSAVASLFHSSQFGNMVLSFKQLEAVCGDPDSWAARHDVTVLLMHHTPEWFTEQGRAELDAITKLGRFDLILVGGADRQRLPRPTKPGGNVWFRAPHWETRRDTSGKRRFAQGRVSSEGPNRTGSVQVWELVAGGDVTLQRDVMRFDLGPARQGSAELLEPVHFEPRLPEEDERKIRAALATFQRYLAQVGFEIGKGRGVTVQRKPGEEIGYYLPGRRPTINIGARPSGADAALFHPYTHHALLIGTRRENFSPDEEAFESGLSLYFPCSFTDSPHAGIDYATHEGIEPADLTRAGRVPRLAPRKSFRDQQKILDAGSAWAAALWDLRPLLGARKVDQLAREVWLRIPQRTTSDPFVELVRCALDAALEEAPGTFRRASEVLRQRGLVWPKEREWVRQSATFLSGKSVVNVQDAARLARQRVGRTLVIAVGACLRSRAQAPSERVELTVLVVGRRGGSSVVAEALGKAVARAGHAVEHARVLAEPAAPTQDLLSRLDESTRTLLQMGQSLDTTLPALLIQGIMDRESDVELALETANDALEALIPALEVAWENPPAFEQFQAAIVDSKRKAATKKSPSKKAPTKKAPSKKKTAAKKSPSKKPSKKKTVPKKAAAKKAATKKAAARKPAAKKAPAKKTAAKKAGSNKAKGRKKMAKRA